MMAAPPNSEWPAGPGSATQQPQQPAGGHDTGLQMKPMGLKVLYTFDRDSHIQCLARWPGTLQIRTIPLDDKTVVGVVDLRTCLQAVARGSPELVSQHDADYSVYSFDVSEPDLPLVGQGMLSWGLDPTNVDAQSQQLLTGRVTRNPLALLGNGCPDTLEVKLRLTAVRTQHQRPEQAHSASHQGNLDFQQYGMRSASSPAPMDAAPAEWSHVRSNLGRAASVSAMPSPAPPMASPCLAPAQINYYPTQESRKDQVQLHPVRHGSMPPVAASSPHMAHSTSVPTSRAERPVPPGGGPPAGFPPSIPVTLAPGPPPLGPSQSPLAASSGGGLHPPEVVMDLPRPGSQPTSRTTSRKRVSSGRPRGRPRKYPIPNQMDIGSTSAAEEATDADEGPLRKRAKITKAEHVPSAPFGAGPDSLRVAASTSGSLRNMRPVGPSAEPAAAAHLQQIPRAPTPIPTAPRPQKPRRAPTKNGQAQTLLTAQAEVTAANNNGASPPTTVSKQPTMQMHAPTPVDDAKSPVDSIAQSPDQGYAAEDSTPDMGSSPPVARMNPHMRSSPMPSSPILPPMPRVPVDSGFMSGGCDDYVDDEDLQRIQRHEQAMYHDPEPIIAAQNLPPPTACPPSNLPKLQQDGPKEKTAYEFQVETPGPPDLLPQTSLYNPASTAKAWTNIERSLRELNTAPSSIQPDVAPPPPPPAPPQREQSEPGLPPLSVPPVRGQDEELFDPSISSASQAEYPPQSQPQGEVQPAPERRESHKDTADRDADSPMTDAAAPEQPQPRFEPITDAPEPRPAAQSQPTAKPALILSTPVPPRALPLSRPSPVTASDPVVQDDEPILSLARAFMSGAPCPASDALEPEPPLTKNTVKKQSIKDRLEHAIQRGVLPTFCANCGAIETPTWRKIWTQDREGIPEKYEYSDKPGLVTFVEILARDEQNQPTWHRLIKKSLGPSDIKCQWKQSVLCNPCGIWLSKFKAHRPQEKWEKDASRLNNPRKKRDASKKSRKGRSNGQQMTLTSEVYLMTDPVGPGDQDLQDEAGQQQQENRTQRQVSQPTENGVTPQGQDGDQWQQHQQTSTHGEGPLKCRGSPRQQRGTGSRHSRGSGTAKSPLRIDDDFGPTRRLLFPSPRKDGESGVLGELALNKVRKTPLDVVPKPAFAGKENEAAAMSSVQSRSESQPPPRISECPQTPIIIDDDDDDDDGLFGTPPIARPSTPPPRSVSAGSAPFKTPNRPTPNHRPITRSISRSIWSAKSTVMANMSPATQSMMLQMQQRTPTRTRWSASNSNNANRTRNHHNSDSTPFTSASKRRNAGLLMATPGRHAHFALEMMAVDHLMESPFTATLNQLLTEAKEFTANSPSHGLGDLDLASLPNLHSDGLHMMHAGAPSLADFQSFTSTDMLLPSSPPAEHHDGRHTKGDGGHGGGSGADADLAFGSSLEGTAVEDMDINMWADFDMTAAVVVETTASA